MSEAPTFKEEQLTTREHMDSDKHWIGESLPAGSVAEIKPTGATSSAGVSPYPARIDHIHQIGTGSITDDMLQNDKVNVAGDTMTGGLFLPGAYLTAAQPTNINALTRKDYVDAQDASIVADYVANRVYVGGDVMTGGLIIDIGDQALTLNNPSTGYGYIGISRGGGRRGWMGMDPSDNMWISSDISQLILSAATGLSINGNPITFTLGGVERARFDSADGYFYVGKTSASFGYVAGVELVTWGVLNASWEANGGALALSHMNAADANGGLYQTFCRYTTPIGSITQNGLSAVSFNTTSHGPWKDVIGELDDDEAIERIKKWRPVAFRWKLDEQDLPSEDGTPQGEVQHGFIAQEMAEIQPSAVTEGFGTEAEHRDWLTRHRLTEEEPFTEMDPFCSWSMDNSKLIPDMTAAIQALIRRIEKLEKKVGALGGTV